MKGNSEELTELQCLNICDTYNVSHLMSHVCDITDDCATPLLGIRLHVVQSPCNISWLLCLASCHEPSLLERWFP